MKIEQSFCVAAPPDAVWESLMDTRLMAQCLPGAELEEGGDPAHLKGRLTVRLGPIVAGFDGTVLVERDESTQAGTMRAQGIDKRTGTRVRAAISYALTGNGNATTITLACEVSLMGALAQFGRKTLIDKIASELIEEFSAALGKQLGAG